MNQLQHRTGGRIVVYDEAGIELGDTVASPAGDASELGEAAGLRAAVLRRRDGLLAGRRGDVAVRHDGRAARRDRLTLVITKRLDDSRAAATVMRAALPLALAAGLAVSLLLALALEPRSVAPAAAATGRRRGARRRGPATTQCG